MTFKVYDPKYPNIEATELLDKLDFLDGYGRDYFQGDRVRAH